MRCQDRGEWKQLRSRPSVTARPFTYQPVRLGDLVTAVMSCSRSRWGHCMMMSDIGMMMSDIVAVFWRRGHPGEKKDQSSKHLFPLRVSLIYVSGPRNYASFRVHQKRIPIPAKFMKA